MNESFQVSSIASLTKVDVMPAHAPAASLPITDNSPSCPLNNFYKRKNIESLVPHTNDTESEVFQNMVTGLPCRFHRQKVERHYKVLSESPRKIQKKFKKMDLK